MAVKRNKWVTESDAKEGFEVRNAQDFVVAYEANGLITIVTDTSAMTKEDALDVMTAINILLNPFPYNAELDGRTRSIL